MNFAAFLNERIYRGIFSRLAARNPPSPDPIRLGPQSRVLIFTCAGIGDTLTDSVVFKALAETFPGIHLAAVVHRRRKILADHNPYCREIFTIQKGVFAFRRLHRQLKKAGPWDAILQLRGNDPEPRCQGFLLSPSKMVSVPNMTRYGWLCGHHVVQSDWDETHGVEQTLRIARYVGADTREPGLVYEVTPDETAGIESRLAALGIRDRPLLVLQIGGGRRAHWRDWPVRRYAELIRLVAADLPCEIVVLGGHDNADRAAELKKLSGGKPDLYHDLVGKLTLTESASLLKAARAVVSTDTGVMHLAFAVGTRTVALIHCNNPSHRVGPYGYGDRHRVLQLPRPAEYRTPSDADMAGITPEQVLAKLREIWT
jgi:heptosyltransferase-1